MKNGKVTLDFPDHHERLISGLWIHFQTGHGTDLTYLGGRAHRLVAELFLSPEELARTCDDPDSHGLALGYLLEFLYRGSVTVEVDMLQRLLEAARKLNFSMLEDAVVAAASAEGPVCNTMESDDHRRQRGAEKSTSQVARLSGGVAVEPFSQPPSLADTRNRRLEDLSRLFELSDDEEETGVSSVVELPTAVKPEQEVSGNEPEDGEGLPAEVKNNPERKEPGSEWKEREMDLTGDESDTGMHCQNRGSLTCGVCGKSYRQRRWLDVHRRTHHDSQSYICQRCGQSFPLTSLLNDHMQEQHNDGELEEAFPVSGSTEKRPTHDQTFVIVNGVPEPVELIRETMEQFLGQSETGPVTDRRLHDLHTLFESSDDERDESLAAGVPASDVGEAPESTEDEPMLVDAAQEAIQCDACGKPSTLLVVHQLTCDSGRLVCCECHEGFLQDSSLNDNESVDPSTGEIVGKHCAMTSDREEASVRTLNEAESAVEGIAELQSLPVEVGSTTITSKLESTVHADVKKRRLSDLCKLFDDEDEPKRKLVVLEGVPEPKEVVLEAAEIVTETTKSTACNPEASVAESNDDDGEEVTVWSDVDSRNLECDVCGKVYRRQQSLYVHRMTHDPRKYICHVCGAAFSQPSHLSSHVNMHTAAKKYACSVCDKVFFRAAAVRRHSRTHSGVKPHHCQVCPKHFFDSQSLKNHMLTHTKERNHCCNVCRKTFARKHHLDTHMRTHKSREDD